MGPFPTLHPPDPSPEEAAAIQTRLRASLRLERPVGAIRRVAGCDVAYDEDERRLFAAVVVIDAADPELPTLEEASVVGEPAFLYVPGLFSFREVPPILAALERLAGDVDLLIADGHGICHPRGFGLACHLGLAADRPTIGCAKTHLVGAWDEPAPTRGAASPIVGPDGDELGRVVRTRDGVRPVFVSPGHLIDIESSADWVVRLAARFRLPEPIRRADARCREDQRRARGSR